MKLLDVNIWLALVLSGHTHHASVRDWLSREQTAASLCFCRATQQGLLRLLTTAEVLAIYGNPPLTNKEAWELYSAFFDDDRIVFANEPAGIDAAWKTQALRGTPSPKLWVDAWLAAFAVQSGFQLVTTDKAFSQFKGLHPLVLKAK